jgi:5-methyltetrahydropteroyltriglutamate--homocysteine methyltransferase
MSKTVFRADQCGSLIRPPSLRAARADYLRKKITPAELEKIENECILSALKMQQAAGLQIFSDREFRRDFWLSAVSDEFYEGMENKGIDFTRHPYLKGKNIKEPEQYVPPNPVVNGKLARKKRITGKEIAFLKMNAPGEFKITVPSPVTLSRASFQPGITDRIYPTWQALFDDYVTLLSEEIGAIVDDGVTYVQLDAPHYSRFLMPNRQQQIRNLGVDLDEELALNIAAENRCLQTAKRPNVTTAVHICLGTFILGPQGPLGGAGEYNETLVARLMEGLDADVFLIEYSERTGNLEAMRMVPKNKMISLGILNTRDPRVETPDEIKYRVDAVAKYVPLENLTICPNCGFSGAAVDTWVAEDIQKRKLAVLVETADQIWG